MKQNDNNRIMPPTRWSLIQRAADPSAPAGHPALEELVQVYRGAMVAHLVVDRNIPLDQAEDAVQSFLLVRLIDGSLLSKAQRSRGKFRNYLLTALEHFTVSRFRQERSRRRCPTTGPPVPLDEQAERIADHRAPIQHEAFDLAWIQAIIQETLRQVEHRCRVTGRHGHWALFQDRLVMPILHGQEPKPYGEIIRELGFCSPLAASNALISVKRMFERHLRKVVREYTESDRAAEEEIREFLAILSRSTPSSTP
jgi:RNA polymerase sigma-70 factor (ECF subfamily)